MPWSMRPAFKCGNVLELAMIVQDSTQQHHVNDNIYFSNMLLGCLGTFNAEEWHSSMAGGKVLASQHPLRTLHERRTRAKRGNNEDIGSS